MSSNRDAKAAQLQWSKESQQGDTIKVFRAMKQKHCQGGTTQAFDVAAMEAGAGGYAAVKDAVGTECVRQAKTNTQAHRAIVYEGMENSAMAALVDTFKDDKNGTMLTEETEDMDVFTALAALATRWGGTDDTEAELAERKLEKLRFGGDISELINEFIQLYNRAVKKKSQISIAGAMSKLLGKIPKHQHVRIELRRRLKAAPVNVTWGMIRTEYVTAEREAKLDQGSDGDSDSDSEMKVDSKKAPKSAQATTTGDDRIARLEGLVASLVETMATNNSRGANQDRDGNSKYFGGKCFGCGKEGHRKAQCRGGGGGGRGQKG
jgi:hypothetical protein